MIDPIHIVIALFLSSFLLAMAAIAESNACHRRAEAQRKMLDRKRAKPRSNPTSE